jgi:hypothetical protein
MTFVGVLIDLEKDKERTHKNSKRPYNERKD